MQSIFDILHKNFEEDQLNSRRFPGGFLNSRRFPGFPGVVDTLSTLLMAWPQTPIIAWVCHDLSPPSANPGSTTGPLTHAQQSCTRNFHKFLAWKILMQVQKNGWQEIWCIRCQPKPQPTSQTSQFWSRVCKFLTHNRAEFYSVKETCTSKTCGRKHDAWSRYLHKLTCKSCTRLLSMHHRNYCHHLHH